MYLPRNTLASDDIEQIYSVELNLIVNCSTLNTDFRTILNEFDDVIDKASFFSIDAEFTGLNNERTCPFNTPSELYKKICSGTDEYIIVQLGITAFRQCTGNSIASKSFKSSTINFSIHFADNADDLIYRSYNFYVYPQGRDQTFRCSGPSMQFLAEQNFDFNKLFRYGISCCTQETANQLRKQLEEKQRYREDLADGNETANVDEVPVPAEELANLDEIRTQIKDFLKSDDKKNIIIGKCNAFQRKLIYQMIDKEFAKDVTATSLQKDNAKVISVERKLSIEEQKKLLDKKNEEEDDELHRLIGLSALVQKISDSVSLGLVIDMSCSQFDRHYFFVAEKTDCRPQHVSGSVLLDSPIFRTSPRFAERIQKTSAQNIPEVSFDSSCNQ